jgi:hypothetical protein
MLKNSNYFVNKKTIRRSLFYILDRFRFMMLGRFESDFMAQYLTGLQDLSGIAQAVLAEGKKLWQAYFSHTDVRSVRDELKLNRPDVGWYQIRKALQARNASGDFVPVSFKPFEESYKALTEKLQHMVYELGFLKV